MTGLSGNRDDALPTILGARVQLVQLVDLPEQELQSSLERLVAAELVYRQKAQPDSTYAFKHALVQDAACQTLLLKTRKHYHRRIAHTLEEHFPQTANGQPELLAHHCTGAELFDEAELTAFEEASRLRPRLRSAWARTRW